MANRNQALPYVEGLYPTDSNMPTVAYNGPTGLVYSSSAQTFFTGRAEKNDTVKASPQITEDAFRMDIAQSHHFTVHIEDMAMSEVHVSTSPLSNGRRGFLPVKTMNLRYTSYENMSIPVAIFGDFPLLNKKRMSTIDLTCYDFDDNKLEYELKQWEADCFPMGRFVAYMNDIAREFVYTGYNVEGKKTLEYRVYVIPAGNVSVSRDYSANDAKIINFSLVVVGDGRTCASGDSKEPSVTKSGLHEV